MYVCCLLKKEKFFFFFSILISLYIINFFNSTSSHVRIKIKKEMMSLCYFCYYSYFSIIIIIKKLENTNQGELL